MIILMKNAFLTIKEAAERFGKAEITVRRLVRNVVQRAKGPDRRLIRPSMSDAERLRRQKKPYSYSISTDLLKKSYGDAMAKVAETLRSKPGGEDPEESLMNILRTANAQLERQLGVKDEQIKALNQSLEDLSERQRETNILMKGLQERLLIEPPKRKWWRLWRK